MFEEIIFEWKYKYEFETFKKGIFTQIFWQNLSLPKWGWKIHVSASIKNFKKIFLKVFHFCCLNKISFKYIATKEDFFRTFSKSYNRFSSGKFITIYCLNDKHFFETICSLNKILLKYKSPFVLTDKPFKKSKCLYYRFGIFKAGLKYIYSDNLKDKFKDNRNDVFKLPNFIKDPFDKKTNSINNISDNNEIRIKSSKFLYSIKSALHFSNFGGIYLATFQKNKHNSFCLIKEFRQYMFDVPELPAIIRGIKEFNIFKKMSKYCCVPKTIESFFYEGHFFFSREFIKGINLKKLKNYKTISFFENINKSQSAEFNIFFSDLYKNLENIANAFHKQYITINDIKLENFIFSNNNKIFLIDGDSCTEISKKTMKAKNPGKNIVFNPEVQDKVLNYSFNNDLVKLNLMIIDLFCQTSNYTKFDKNNATWRIEKKLNLVCEKYNINNFFINSLKNNVDIKINNKEEILDFFNDFDSKKIYFNEFKNFNKQITKILNYSLFNKINDKEKFFSKSFFNNILLDKKINLTDKDFNNLDWPILLIIIFNDLYYLKHKLINFIEKTLKHFNKNKINHHTKINELFLYASCFLIKIKFNICTDEIIENLQTIFDFIINEKLLKNINGTSNIYSLRNFNFLSPHLNNGTVGLILTLLIYTHMSKDTKYKKTIEKLFNIFEVSYLSKITFSNGISGYLIAYILFMKIFKHDSIFLNFNKKIFQFNLNLIKEKLVNIFLSVKNNNGKDIIFIDLHYEINKKQKEYYYILLSLALSKKILKEEFYSEII